MLSFGTALAVGLTSLTTATATASAPAAPTASSAASRTTTVTLKHISFIKATARIHRGDKVTWVWKDPTVPHNVTFARRHSGTKQTGTYTLTFEAAGTFEYRCTIHPGMDGKVVVR